MQHISSRVLLRIALALVLVFAIAGCGSEDPAAPAADPPDTVAPSVMGARSLDRDRVNVAFSEPVKKASAEDVANYLVEQIVTPSPILKWQRQPSMSDVPLTIVGAELQLDNKTVILTTQGMDVFASYRVTVSGVKDLADNVMAASAEQNVANEIKSERILTIAGTGLPALGGENMDPLQSDLFLVQDMTIGPDGFLYVLDWNNHRVRVIENGKIRTIIGTGLLGDASPGYGLDLSLNHPTHVAFDPQGRLLLSAWHNSKIVRMDMNTRWCEVICNSSGGRAYGGDGGPAYDAIINLVSSIAVDQQGRLVFCDQANQRYRRINLDGTIETIAGTGTVCAGSCGDGGQALNARFFNPVGQNAFPGGRCVFDADYNLYLCDTNNHRVRRIDAVTGVITNVAGNGTQDFFGDGGNAVDAALDYPADLAFDPDGNLYIAEANNHVIRKVDTNGIISTFAGQGGTFGYTGDGGRPADATLYSPYGVMVDSQGNVYIADTKNHVIRVAYK